MAVNGTTRVVVHLGDGPCDWRPQGTKARCNMNARHWVGAQGRYCPYHYPKAHEIHARTIGHEKEED